MSEIKPFGYLITENETGNVVFTKRSPSLTDMQEFELICTPCYTEGHLAEAVAAERERCAKVCEELISEIFHERSSSPEPETGGVSVSSEDQEIITYLEEAIKAIRSAAK